MESIGLNKYNDILRQIVSEIKSTRVVVARRVNTEMMQLYWNIGKRLSTEGLEKGYGSSVVKQLANDLQQEFPGTTGFSARNLWNMKQFYEFYALADEKVQRSVALLPWRHNLLIISKAKSMDEAEFYCEQVFQNNWSRDILLNFIKADTFKNTKLLPKLHNFEKTLPENLQEQADETNMIAEKHKPDKQYTCEFHPVEISFNERPFVPRDIQYIKSSAEMKY